jgi:hypothetical protein
MLAMLWLCWPGIVLHSWLCCAGVVLRCGCAGVGAGLELVLFVPVCLRRWLHASAGAAGCAWLFTPCLHC